jgi:ribosomal protein S18 acetylase RimI-like enzyme
MPQLVINETHDPGLLASIHAETVNVAYAGFFPAGDIPPTVDEHRATWEVRLADPTAIALVARVAGRPVGSVMARRDPDLPDRGQITGLHVLPTEWGQGVGTALHDAAVATLAAQGVATVELWVIEANRRARRLYESKGWRLVPGVVLEVAGITEVRYRRRVPPPPGDPLGPGSG